MTVLPLFLSRFEDCQSENIVMQLGQHVGNDKQAKLRTQHWGGRERGDATQAAYDVDKAGLDFCLMEQIYTDTGLKKSRHGKAWPQAQTSSPRPAV